MQVCAQDQCQLDSISICVMCSKQELCISFHCRSSWNYQL